MTSYYPSTPVVVICEALSPEFRGQYEGGGAVRIVEKPIDLRKLVSIIQDCGPPQGLLRQPDRARVLRLRADGRRLGARQAAGRHHPPGQRLHLV
jgi:hypothetical protein